MIQLVVPLMESGGVYDFARRLRCAVGGGGVQLVHLSKENAATWEVGLEDAVVLQFSGYGFAKRGAPLWLLREVERRRKCIKTLGVFFHELYAFGAPWSSSFWLSPAQRYIARRLAGLSDFWMTSREGSARWLRQFAGSKPHAVLPVFSNIGDVESLAPVRAARMVVFGSAGLREATYKAAGANLFPWTRRAGLEVHDCGAPVLDDSLAKTLRANGVIQHGWLDCREIRRLMLDALFGLLAYPIGYVAKSGVFAAYCAYGVCPVLVSRDYAETDGLVAHSHYLPGVPDAVDVAQAASVGQAAWRWYQPHSLSVHAQTLIKFVGANSASCRC